jgi:type 1 glutamine amidotransferase
MDVSLMARPCVRALRTTAALLACLAFVPSPAAASAGKVLVFTGTAGTPNASSAAAATAIQALATANDFTADVSDSAAQLTATNLANYRAVVFVNSAGDVLDDAQEAALQDYVHKGGGFVGIGETALLERNGTTFFNTLLGLAAARITGTGTSSAQDVEFLDRVHPATRQQPLVSGRTETWYTWATNPTGTVHTIARVRGNTLPDGTSITNDAVLRFTGATNTNQPQRNSPAAWCRDVQQGRSLYTSLGSNAESLADEAVRKHLLGAVQWAAGMVRGNCKASINSNYSATRITPVQATGSNQFYGEMTKSALSDDGRIFYGGRAICFQGYTQIGNWDSPNTGLGCGTVHVWDGRVEGSNNQNPTKISFIANLSVFGAKGNATEYGQSSTSEAGMVGMTLDPDFTNGRPYVYIQYYPYWGGEQGKDTEPKLGPGFVGLKTANGNSYLGEKRLSRFTYDEATKSFMPGSEKVIFSYVSPVYNCCHNGAGMDWDSKGNLYITNGDNVPNGNGGGANNLSNNNTGGYVNPHPQFTIPCPGDAPTTHCGIARTDPDGDGPQTGHTPCAAALAITDADPNTNAAPGSLAACGYTSYGDARATSGNTNVYEGKIVRIKPLANPGDEPGVGNTYTIPGADAPNGPNLFGADSQAVRDGKAKPEIFSMGVRSTYTIHIDPKTDAITTAWIGPDQGTESPTWGPAKTENATMMNSAGNWGWPFCQAGNRWSYRAKLPTLNGSDPAAAAPFGHPNTVGGGADGETGGYFDCRGPVVNDSPYNSGLTTVPAPKPVNIWYGPQGGCFGYPVNANGVNITTSSNTSPAPAISRRCPWIIGGSQAPIDGGIYRKPAGDKPDAWPSYWDGRWFMIDFANTNATRHALLMDPATQFEGGQPVSADSLYGIVPTSLIGGVRPVFMDFGSDGALYVGSYAGSYYAFSNNNMGVWRFAYTGGADTPGPDPKAIVPENGSLIQFDIGASGGISRTWDFGDGSPKVTTTDQVVSHTYDSAGTRNVTLTVNYADGEVASKTITVDVPTPLFLHVNEDVSANVPMVLALTLGSAPSFGQFQPSVDRDYDASTTATVLATSGAALLTVSDPATGTTGKLVNGDYTLPSGLLTRALSAKGAGGAFAPVGGTASPTPLLNYSGAVNDGAVTLEFKQHIGVPDALRAGRYSKTLTFTLSTTTP